MNTTFFNSLEKSIQKRFPGAEFLGYTGQDNGKFAIADYIITVNSRNLKLRKTSVGAKTSWAVRDGYTGSQLTGDSLVRQTRNRICAAL